MPFMTHSWKLFHILFVSSELLSPGHTQGVGGLFATP